MCASYRQAIATRVQRDVQRGLAHRRDVQMAWRACVMRCGVDCRTGRAYGEACPGVLPMARNMTWIGNEVRAVTRKGCACSDSERKSGLARSDSERKAVLSALAVSSAEEGACQ